MIVLLRFDCFVGRAAKQVNSMFVDAAEIAVPECDAMTVQEFKNLDRDFAAIVEPVAKLRRAELHARLPFDNVNDDCHDLGHGLAQEKVIMRYFVKPSHAAEQLHEPPHLAFRD
jgi:hypothetical protein